MAFIFSDLVVFPVLRIQAKYYGWKMAFYIMGVFLTVLIATALLMHYGFAAFDMLPDPSSAQNVTDREFFKVDYTLFLNAVFGMVSLGFLGWALKKHSGHSMGNDKLSEKILFWLAMFAYLWLVGGIFITIFI